MDAIAKLEMETRFNREIDHLRSELKDKASNKDVTQVAAALSQTQLDQAERNRALRDSVGEVEKAVKALAQVVAADVGGSPIPASRWSLRGLDPKLVLTIGIAGGAAAGKTLEYIMGLGS